MHQLRLWKCSQTLEKRSSLLFPMFYCGTLLWLLLLLGWNVASSWLLEFGLGLLGILLLKIWWLILKNLSLRLIDGIIWLRAIKINVSWLYWHPANWTASHVSRPHGWCLIYDLIPWNRIALIINHLKYISRLVLSGIGVVRSPSVSLTSGHFSF